MKPSSTAARMSKQWLLSQTNQCWATMKKTTEVLVGSMGGNKCINDIAMKVVLMPNWKLIQFTLFIHSTHLGSLLRSEASSHQYKRSDSKKAQPEPSLTALDWRQAYSEDKPCWNLRNLLESYQAIQLLFHDVANTKEGFLYRLNWPLLEHQLSH